MKIESNNFPSHIKEEFPHFIKFVELYYEFMNSTKVSYVSDDEFTITFT